MKAKETLRETRKKIGEQNEKSKMSSLCKHVP